MQTKRNTLLVIVAALAATACSHQDRMKPVVTAYEAGMKSEMLNGTLRANVSAFYNDYKNMQLAQRISASAVTANADATTSGVEAELLFAPSRAWLFDANVSLLRTNPDAFIGGNVNRLKAGAVLDMPTEAQAAADVAGGCAKSVGMLLYTTASKV